MFVITDQKNSEKTDKQLRQNKTIWKKIDWVPKLVSNEDKCKGLKVRLPIQ